MVCHPELGKDEVSHGGLGPTMMPNDVELCPRPLPLCSGTTCNVLKVISVSQVLTSAICWLTKM